MELPLFPLHTVLCPGIALPLRIFEPRYRLMVARCLDGSSPFGVTWIRLGREVGAGDLAVADVGTMAEIREATVLPDGRYELVAVGTRRFRIGSVATDAAPYLVAEVDPLEEVVDDERRARRLSRLVTRRFVRYVERVRELGLDAVGGAEDQDDAEDPDAAVSNAALAGAEPEASDPAPAHPEARGPEPEAGSEPETEPEPRAATGPPDTGVTEEPGAPLAIPADPTLLSHLLSGIVELDLPRRQGLLERETTDQRLGDLAAILARETAYLAGRLRVFIPDPASGASSRN